MKLGDKFVGKRGCVAVAVLLFALYACVNEELAKSDTLGGEDALVNISFGMVAPQGVNASATRASAETEEAITSLHILVFNAAGSLQTLKYIADYRGATAAEKQISTRSGGNCTIYAVANMRQQNTGSEGGGSFFDDIVTLSQFESRFSTIVGADVERNAGMLMCGKLTGVTISPLPVLTKPEQQLLLYRLSSKITINIKDGTPEGESVMVKDYEIYNLPLHSYFANNSTDYYTNNTSLAAGAFYQVIQRGFVDVEAIYDGVSTGLVKQGQFYMVENRRGVVNTSTDQREKARYAPAYATYALINANYMNNNNGTVTSAKYKIYLGANNSNDYNIERNRLYTYNITITGASETDVNVDSRVNASQTFVVSIANQTLDAHYDWQAFQIDATAGHTKVEILNMDGTPVNATTSWLKFSRLSTYPNRADVNANPANATVTTETIDHTGTPESYMRYLYADENLSGTNRKLKVRITTTVDSDVAALVNPARCVTIDKEITQKTIEYAGMFAGAMNTGGYTKQLGVECIEEYAIPYKDGITATTVSGMQWGFRDITTGVTDNSDGLANTKDLVGRTTPANGGLSGIFHPVLNTYAARYCYEKNRDVDGNGTLDDAEKVWYLPAQNQLMGIWTAHSGLQTSFSRAYYRSSTESGLNGGWLVSFSNGYTGYSYKSDDTYRVRCVRDLTPPVSAQQVVVKNGFVIIDSRNGMPAGAITATPRPLVTDGTDTAMGTNTTDNLSSTVNNAKVYHYFAVSKVGNSTGSNWSNTFTVCRNYNSGDGTAKWRLPTQRELMLMYILKDPLVTAGVASLSTSYVWSSWESDNNNSWVVTFTNGYTGNIHSKSSPYIVRCVRDLTP